VDLKNCLELDINITNIVLDINITNIVLK